MKQFLSSDANDKVLTKWQSLKLTPYESIHKYVYKFWDLHLKATVYKKIDFEEQKQQFCAGLPEDMNEYVNFQRPKTISAIIHHTMVAARINFQQGAKRNLNPMEIKEKHEHKGKNQPQNSSKGNSSNNKAKEKGVYKGKNRFTLEELERYRKDNQCFKCGDQGHAYRACPQRNAHNEQPRASIIEAPKEDVHCKGSPLSYAWGKVREHDAFILFDPGSTHNFISHELAAKLGIKEFEMGDAMKADGAFIGQDASVTPLIGRLRLHIQGFVDKEDFLISPLKHEDVISGAPWFDRMAASIKFPERRISFKFREKNMYTDAQELAHHKKVKGKGKSSSATINQPKDAHSPSTAKGRPPRSAKEQPSTSKKRPRLAVSESSESLEEQFELLSQEYAEDFRHADSEQQSDSLRLSQVSSSQGAFKIFTGCWGHFRIQDRWTLTPDLEALRLMWEDLPTHCKVDAGFGGVLLWNVFTDGIIQSVATLIVAMFVRDLDGPLPVPIYDRRADDIAADIDGYEADSDML
ncbi:hypothetical protein L7F22_027542 [Adiantum nelumboides]|nr:hypothetical protein [Adiantum nelumboides]